MFLKSLFTWGAGGIFNISELNGLGEEIHICLYWFNFPVS